METMVYMGQKMSSKVMLRGEECPTPEMWEARVKELGCSMRARFIRRLTFYMRSVTPLSRLSKRGGWSCHVSSTSTPKAHGSELHAVHIDGSCRSVLVHKDVFS
jgi:hypothetical protein